MCGCKLKGRNPNSGSYLATVQEVAEPIWGIADEPKMIVYVDKQ